MVSEGPLYLCHHGYGEYCMLPYYLSYSVIYALHPYYSYKFPYTLYPSTLLPTSPPSFFISLPSSHLFTLCSLHSTRPFLHLIPHMQPFDRSYIDNPGPMVVFATPGMLHAGLSLHIFKKWAEDERNMVSKKKS